MLGGNELHLIALKNFQIVKVMLILLQIQQTTMTVSVTAIKLMIMTTIILTKLETFHWQLKWMFSKVEYQGENSPVNEDFYHGILFGGDQVTVCRSRVHNLQEAMMTVLLEGWRVLQQ